MPHIAVVNAEAIPEPAGRALEDLVHVTAVGPQLMTDVLREPVLDP